MRRAAVVDLAVGDAACARGAAERLTAAGAWDAALADAASWGVVALLHARLDAALLPPGALAALRVESLRATLRSRLMVERGLAVLRLLDEAGIAALAVKGVGAIAALGPRAAARTTKDLDVVVRQRDEAAARALLRAHGYREVNPPFDRHMAEIALSRQLHNVARTLRKDTFEVDVHWRFGPQPPPELAADRLIARGTAVAIGTTAFRAADPVDAVLIAVHHALRTSFVPEAAARDLCDLVAWWDDGRVPARLDELLGAAQGAGLATSLLALWNCVLRRNPAHPLRHGSERLAGELGAAERGEAALLERHFEQVLVQGKPARFTLEIFAPRLYARWLAGTLAGALRRASPGPATDGTPTPPRGPLGRRIANLPPRAWRILRELTRVRNLAAYRAVAQAQSRFH